MKKSFLTAIMCLGFIVNQNLQAQSDTNSSSKKQEEKVLERPQPCGASNVDAYTTKSFDSYDESRSISKDINFIEVKVTPVHDKGDGVSTETTITNGNGQTVTKTSALEQFGKLLLRTAKQTENIKAVQALQPPATTEVKTISPMKKPKAVKVMGKGTDALTYVISETKKQTDLINQQIATLKALKNN